MPDRVLRAELLESEAWLALKDNSDRVCFLSCILTADNFGQMPAGPYRLVKLWRPYGIDTPEKSAKVFGDLVDVDLVRRYTVDAKPYLYIPKFRQSRRFLGHIWPLSPWVSNEELQRLAQKSPVNHLRSPVNHGESPLGVGVGVGVGKKRSSASSPVDKLRDGETWAQHWIAKGKALGIEAKPGEAERAYCNRVIERVKA